MKNKNISIIALAVLLIFLTSCGALNLRGASAPETKWHSGKQGLSVSFMENLPEKEFYFASNLKIGLMIENSGFADVEEAWLLISSYDKNLLQGPNRDLPLTNIALKGKTRYSPMGDRAFEYFDFLLNPQPLEVYPDSFVVTVCYPYFTETVEEVCVSPLLREFETRTTRVCEVKDITLTGGQGGPVEITKIEETIIPYDDRISVRFKINVRNAGKGFVYAKYSFYKECSKDSYDYIVESDKNLIEINAKLSGRDLVCNIDSREFVNKIKLNEKGEGYAICEVMMEKPASSYVAALEIKLDYGYAESIVKTVKYMSYAYSVDPDRMFR